MKIINDTYRSTLSVPTNNEDIDAVFVYYDTDLWERKELTILDGISELPEEPDYEDFRVKSSRYWYPTEDYAIHGTEYGWPFHATLTHNRLLYDVLLGELVTPFSENRALVYTDLHDDVFYSGYRKYFGFDDINVGNWITAGILLGVWNKVYHLDSNRSAGVFRKSKNWEVPLADDSSISVPYESIPIWRGPNVLKEILQKEEKVIVSLDSDAYAALLNPLRSSARKTMRAIIDIVKTNKQNNIDLVHYCHSPEYNPYFLDVWKEAVKNLKGKEE